MFSKIKMYIKSFLHSFSKKVNKHEKTIIVYSRTNIDSVIAAASIGALIHGVEYSQGADVGTNGTTYIFVGTIPTRLLSRQLKRNHATVKLINYGSVVSESELSDDYKSPTLIDGAIGLISAVGITHSAVLHALSLMVYMFDHDKHCDQREIAVLYFNYMMALEAIGGKEAYAPTYPEEDVMPLFAQTLVSIKALMTKTYHVEEIECGKEYYSKILLCNLPQDITPFAMRIAKAAYKNVAIYENVRGTAVVTCSLQSPGAAEGLKKFFSPNAVMSTEARMVR